MDTPRGKMSKTKVTSADCIRFITERIVPELANPKNWIRTQKKKGLLRCETIRVFKNKKTGLEIEVMEQNGVIKQDLVIFNNQWLKTRNPEDDWDGDKILFCLTKAKHFDGPSSDIIQMYIVEKKFYDRTKHLDDGIHTGPSSALLREHGFDCGEFIEGGIEFETDVNLEALKAYLAKSKVFITTKAFQKWMENPDYEVIHI